MTAFGFVGCGKITAAVASGFCTPGWQPSRITVSPRNAEKAAALAAASPLVTIGENNQAVVDAADIVFIGLLPKVAEEELPTLTFRPDQYIISMMATKSHSDVVRLTRMPAERVTTSVPLPPASKRLGPVLVFPANQWALDIYKHIGTPVAVKEEAQMKALIPVTGLISPFYAIENAAHEWCVAAGAEPEAAGAFIGSFFHALASGSKEYPAGGFGEMAEEAATPGGLNEASWKYLGSKGTWDQFKDCCDTTIVKLGAPAPPR
eukprot:JP446678.1.p1 GENE.JP446678.1~~JP446678.1.p1  ORF type:complete len:263 (+),score=78.17 JP446678.1:35-823(+)